MIKSRKDSSRMVWLQRKEGLKDDYNQERLEGMWKRMHESENSSVEDCAW